MNKTVKDTFGLIKTHTDAHTMGIHAAASLLADCGYNVVIASNIIEEAAEKIETESAQKLIVEWIKNNRIARLGFSYRLDQDTAITLFGKLIYVLKKNNLYEKDGCQIKSCFFAGLKDGCDYIDSEYQGRICTFRGGESPEESLLAMGIPFEEIPPNVIEGCKYDKDLISFGRNVINSGEHSKYTPLERTPYKLFGTMKDTLELRLKHNFKAGFQPLIRAHSGPFNAEKTREKCLEEYQIWCRQLADAGLLDILSIGTSQLSQSNFGENWDGKINGGGVPVNSEKEYIDIWNASRPMLVRTYSGTSKIRELAEIYEKTINISWHALSLWWFDELDGRGPNTLYKNLCEHVRTIEYIAQTHKPLETNVSHHFAFRGCDDITYVLSGYLAARTAKEKGIRTFVLQNMLNTPRSTWGIQDLAKGRALLKLVKELEDDEFRVILQTRAGLDFFKPDIEYAKIQLAAVTAMMDDIDPFNIYNPEIIHVVSYSEALFLATPEILNDSIRITRSALDNYRELKRRGLTANVLTDDIMQREDTIVKAVKTIIKVMEENIESLYSPDGLYMAFIEGWLPVPDLWSDSEEFRFAKSWGTKLDKGGVVLCDGEFPVTIEHRINRCISNIPEAYYIMKRKYDL